VVGTELVRDPAELPSSRLFTFIDEPRRYALYFLEGQRLIHDLALVPNRVGNIFGYYRDVVLSLQPVIALLKHGEQLGFYLDSERPYFRLKIETAHAGTTRCMVLPEQMDQKPTTMTGIVRVTKLFPGGRPPYQSIIAADDLELKEIVNRILRDSYQVNSVVTVSSNSDQSAMLHQLPPMPAESDYDFSETALKTRRDGIRDGLESLMSRALTSADEIQAEFGKLGFRLLASRDVAFRCSCAREWMLGSLRSVYAQEGDSLFEPDSETLEVVCEYCKNRYTFSRSELRTGPSTN